MADRKKQRELFILAALVVTAGLVWFFYFGHSPAGKTGYRLNPTAYTPINAQDFGKVFEQLKSAETTEYKPTGRNIFIAAPLAPPVDPNAKVVEPVHAPIGPTPPPPPPPPVLSMKFYGYGTLPQGGARRAFLLDGEEVRIVSEGEIVQNHIRILHIGNDRIEFEDTNTGLRSSNPLEVQPAV